MPKSIVTGVYPATRMRRLRQFDWSRRLVRESRPTPDNLVWGMIVHDGKEPRVPVKTMPGVDRLNVDEAAKAARQAPITRRGLWRRRTSPPAVTIITPMSKVTARSEKNRRMPIATPRDSSRDSEPTTFASSSEVDPVDTLPTSKGNAPVTG